MIKNLRNRAGYELKFEALHIGDYVRVRPDISCGEREYITSDIIGNYIDFFPEMYEYRGKVGKIFSINYSRKTVLLTFNDTLYAGSWPSNWLETP